MNPRAVIWLGILMLTGCGSIDEPANGAKDPPNFVIIFCDDLGYGDLGVFGHPTIRTPQLDRMAVEGQKWTSFYVGASVCTPSRTALMTGRLPIRSGMCSDARRVLFPDSGGGLPASEVTVAEILSERGYATACVGKWHLGHLPQFLPVAHGFDSYFGIPYSNDMDRVEGAPRGWALHRAPDTDHWNVPLMRNKEVVERPANQHTLTQRYTEEAVQFINAHKEGPFFLYLAHTMPHVPLFRSENFANTSLRGVYGDVVEEIDWSVGTILDTLRKLHLDEDTLVIFTSDNGPWLTYDTYGGSAGLLRGGKGGTFEGGMREPTLFWWPGTIQPRIVTDMGATMDILPTLVELSGAELPSDRILDGQSLEPVIKGKGSSPRDTVFYYRNTELYAVRKGPYKAHYFTKPEYGEGDLVQHDPPLLYHLEHDPSETVDIADKHPEVIEELRRVSEIHKSTVKMVPDQLAIPVDQDSTD